MDSSGGYPVVSYLLQQTLHRLCTDSDWIYAVFWRILPRNYPPPKWDSESSVLDRSKGNKRNWILVWEDGFCDFVAAKSAISEPNASTSHNSGSPDQQRGSNDQGCQTQYMQPELFFKMSHEVYNFGEGLMGKVAADNSHKWVYKEPMEADPQYLSSWQGALDPHPRTWEAQFKSGIETIAIVAVKEGVLQLGSLKKNTEDLNFVLFLQRKFNYLQSIPGVYAVHPVLMQHATSSKKAVAAAAAAVGDSWPSEQPHQPSSAEYWPLDQHLHHLQHHHQQQQQQQKLNMAVVRAAAGENPSSLDAPDHAAHHLPLPLQLDVAPPSAYHVIPAAAGGLQAARASASTSQHLPLQLDASPSAHNVMQASLQALLSRLPSVTSPPPSAANSSSSSPTFQQHGHPYLAQQAPFLHQVPVATHHHAPTQPSATQRHLNYSSEVPKQDQLGGFSPSSTPHMLYSQPLSDQDLDPAFLKGMIG